MKKFLLLAAVVGAAATLTACGGGSSPAQLAAQDASIAINASNGQTVLSGIANQSFDFSSGVPAFGTTGDTTVTYTNGGSDFQIASGGNTASGTMSFGSCHFNVTSSSIPGIVAGSTMNVDPCNLAVALKGASANGTTTTRQVSFTLGSVTSASMSLPVTLYSNGTFSISNVVIGTVTTTPVTGS